MSTVNLERPPARRSYGSESEPYNLSSYLFFSYTILQISIGFPELLNIFARKLKGEI